MLAKILGFEFKYQLRNPILLCAIPILLAMVAIAYYGRAIDITSNDLRIGLNAPLVIAKQLQTYQLMLYIVVTFLLGNAVLREKEFRLQEIFYATPVSTKTLYTGKFLAIFLLTVPVTICFAAVSEFVLQFIAIQSAAILPFDPLSYAYTYALLLLPNLLIFSLIACAAILATGTIFGGFTVLILFLLFSYAINTVDTWFFPEFCALADPGGACSLNQASQNWTSADYKNLKFPYSMLFFWNRVIWIGLSIALFAIALVRHKRQLAETRARSQTLEDNSLAATNNTSHSNVPLPKIQPGENSILEGLLTRIRFELGLLLKSYSFPVIILLLIAGCALALWVALLDPFLAFFPVSMLMAPQITQGAVLGGGLVIMFLAGEMVWREKRNNISGILYATPASNLLIYSGKLAALFIYLMIYLGLAILFGILYQISSNVPDVRADFYIVTGVMEVVLPLFFHAAFAMLVHVLTPSRLLAHFITYALLILELIIFINYGVENHLVLFGSIPPVPVSDMNGFGHYLTSSAWLAAYWTAITALLASISLLFWSRMPDTSLITRWRAASPALRRGVTLASSLAILSASTTGGYIYWNTHIRHVYYTEKDQEKSRAKYEKELTRFIGKPQPLVTGITLTADLDAEKRIMTTEGSIRLTNRTDQEIYEVILSFDNNLKVEHYKLEGAELSWKSPNSHEYILKSGLPIRPGETRKLEIKTILSNAGFQHRLQPTATPINNNGTSIFNAQFLPQIGVDSKQFLTDAGKRITYKLPHFSKLESKGLWSNKRSYYSHDAQYLDLDLTISTTGNQTAVAPGILKKQWKSGGKSYFHYVTDQPIDNLWIIHSGNYAVAKGKWKHVDLAYYHHKTHNQTAYSIIKTMKASLDYFRFEFGPYPFKYLRTTEFPYRSTAMAFPGTISYPESFLMHDIYGRNSGSDFNYVIAHEVAHQWWGLQVNPADHPGALLLSESLAEYSALVMLGKKKGLHDVQHYLTYALDNYLRKRGQTFNENPMSRIDGSQLHLAYDKGTLVMHAFKRAVGEQTVNRALRILLQNYKKQDGLYPTADDLISLFKQESGSEFDTLIDDLFNRITFWEFSLPSATISPTSDGQWKVTANLQASKNYSTNLGEKTEADINNKVEFGFFKSHPATGGYSDINLIAIQKRKISNKQTKLEFILKERPQYIMVNPYLALTESELDDNGASLN